MGIKDRIIRFAQGHLHVERVYGKEFNKTYKFLEKSQWWDEKTHEEYQLEQLKKVVKNAYDNVPYYTKLFNKHGIKPEKIKSFEDFEKIPYLTKEMICENIDELYNKNYPKYKIEYKTTGGSTGVPMGLYQDRFYTRKVENAYVTHMWNRVGYDIKKKHKIIYIRGIHIEGEKEINGKHMILNSFLINDESFRRYAEEIKQFNPDFINGYPSAIYILAKHMVDNNLCIELPNLKAILLSSENVYDFQREIIEKAFGKKTYTFYGHTERACIGGECEESRAYHLQSEYGYTELINSEGKKVTKEGELGEIVCTGFINPVMPFIRYKTSDIAVNTLEKCSCGRNYKLIKRIEGRIQDFIIDSKNNTLTFTCQDEPLWHIKEKMNAYQYVQNEKGKLVLNISPKEPLSEKEIQVIHDEFENIFKNIQLEICNVDHIERTKSGKFRYLIQNINKKEFNI